MPLAKSDLVKSVLIFIARWGSLVNGTVACFEGAIYAVACMLLNVFMFGIGNAYVM